MNLSNEDQRERMERGSLLDQQRCENNGIVDQSSAYDGDEKGEKKGSFVNMVFNAGWLTGARLFGDCASLLLFVILARHFGVGGIGQYAYALALAGLIYAVVNLGLEDYAIRECSCLRLEERRGLIARVIGTQLGVMILASLGLIGFLFVTNATTETAMMILWLSGYQLALAFVKTLFVPAFARESMVGPAVTELICRLVVISAVVLLVVALNSPLSWSLIPFPIGGALLVFLAVNSARRHNGGVSVSINVSDSIVLIKSAWPFAASVVVFMIYSRLGLIIVSLILGDEPAGIYASSLKFLEVGAIPLFFLGFAGYPALSRLGRDNRRGLLEAMDNFHRVILIAGALLSWALFFVVPPVLVPLLGEEFTPAVFVVRVMAVLGVVIGAKTILIRLLLATDRQVKRVELQFYATLMNGLLSVVLIPVIGVLGAVGAFIMAEVCASVFYFIALQRTVPITPLLRTMVSFFVPVAVGCLVGLLLDWKGSNEWLPAAVSLAAFGLGTVIIGFIQKPAALKRVLTSF